MLFGRFSGSHFEMGRQHGEAFASQLGKNRDALHSASRVATGPDAPSLAEVLQQEDLLVTKFESALRRTAPELIEEMQGSAQGSGLSYQDVVRLNFAEEIAGGNLGCSQFGMVASDGSAVMGKNEDAGYGHRTYAATELHPDNGHAQVHVGAVNWVVSSGSGINDAGLCLGQSSLKVTDEADGIPRLTMLRLVLERCANVSEAADLLKTKTGGLRGMNFLMVDANGDMAVVERSPSRCAVRRPQDGAIWATNHPIDPQMRAVEKMILGTEDGLDRTLALDANTRQRFGRLGALAREYARPSGHDEVLRSVENVVQSHGPCGMCQHGIMQTTWSVLMDARKRELSLADEYPCTAAWERFSLAN